MIDQILRSTGLIGDRRIADVDAQPVVECGEDLLVVDRTILWDFAQAVRRTDYLADAHPAARQETAGDLRPMPGTLVAIG